MVTITVPENVVEGGPYIGLGLEVVPADVWGSRLAFCHADQLLELLSQGQTVFVRVILIVSVVSYVRVDVVVSFPWVDVVAQPEYTVDDAPVSVVEGVTVTVEDAVLVAVTKTVVLVVSTVCTVLVATAVATEK